MAKKSQNQFRDFYLKALRDYLDGGGERALVHGYELGRKAVVNGLGVLDAVGVHKQALEKSLLVHLNHEDRAGLSRAMEFFSETLSSFEVTHRAFREANVKLRLLSEHLQSVREEEQTRIARDIHDELGRALTCLKLDLSLLHNKLLAETNGNPEVLKTPPKEKLAGKEPSVLDKTGSMLKLIDQTIQTVRKIATELRPSVLDDLGLEAAIEWQSREFEGRSGIQCKLTLPKRNIVMNPRISTAIFRIFQEILTNVARHSQASCITICLQKKGVNLVLTVQDNGKGIEPSKITAVQSLGLLGMRERASFLGGDVRISGRRARGTRVTVGIPLLGEP